MSNPLPPGPATPATETVLQRLNRTSGGQGFNKWFGVQGLKADDTGAEILLEIRPEHCQHHGYVHGGCVASLADVACAWAGSAASNKDVVTSNFTIHYLSPAIGDRLRAKSRTIRAGRSQVTVEAEIWAEAEGRDPKLVAQALSGIAVLPERRPRID